MRHSGRRLAEVAALLREAIRPGVTTAELDAVSEQAIRARGAISSFKGYKVGTSMPFPATICASPNQVVVHGIPDKRELVSGDIISIDVGLVYGGYNADCAFTVAVGPPSPEVARLLDITEKSLYMGIARAVPGSRVGDIGNAIESFVKPHGYGIVQEYVGHGIGRLMHEPPSIPNYGKPHKGLLLKEGTCIAIEPMITMGRHTTKVLKDGWTVVTTDGSLAAHFEHTIAITARGPEILTTFDGHPPSA